MKKAKAAPGIQDERAFHNVALTLMTLLAIYCIIPFFLMLSISLSTENALANNGYTFIPKEWSLAAYDYMWAKRYTIGRCYALTIIVTVAGTLGNLVLTSLFAYPLSRKDFKLRNFFAFFVISFSSTRRLDRSSATFTIFSASFFASSKIIFRSVTISFACLIS